MNASKQLNRLAGSLLPAALGLLTLAGSAYAQNVPYSEDFDAATTATFRTVAYRALPGDPTTPMYHALGGGSAMTIVDGALNFVGARFTIGNTQPTVVSTPTSAPPGIFDLSQTYTVSFCLLAASGSGNLQVYVDNNTTGQANSPFGNASRIYSAAVGTLAGGTVISVTSSVGTATSFVYLRTESSADATIDNFRIDYGSTGSATCPSGSSSSSSSESSSSSSESSSSSSDSSSSSSSGTSNLPFFENFDAASEGAANGGSPSNLWQAAYRSIPGDPATPMFIATGGGSGLIVTPDRSLSLTGARFTIGNTIPLQTSTPTSAPPGIFDLGSQYTISFCVLSTSEDGFFYVYVDNNTTNSGNSPLGAASRLVEEPVANMTPGTVYSLTSSVGTPTSFLQLRTNAATTVVMDNLSIDAGPVGSATCPPPAPVSAFSEDFDAATTATLLTAGYRALPDHPAIPMFHSSATSRTDVINNALSFMGAVFTVGNTTPAVLTTAADTATSGIFDLSQEYTISFCFVGSDGLDGTRKLQVQIDNNSSGAANSIHGVASRIFNEDVGTLTPQTVYSVTSTVGTPTSIFSLRMENNERVAIDNLTLDYGSVGTATCPPPTSSSSSSSSDGGGSSSSNSSSSSDPGGPGTLTCAAANTVQGFASLGNGTTGGEGGREVTVTNGVELVAALATQINNPNPLKIWVDGTITAANSGGASKFDVKDMDNVSIIGLPGALFDGIGIKIWRANNIIVRNVTMRYVNIGDKDHIGLEGPASNVWIDHNQFYNSLDVHIDFYDELVSGKGNIDNITVSYNYFHDSWKTSLWGSSDTDNFNRRVSFIGNRWERVSSRLPLFRFGEGHVLNNYYTDVRTTGINSRMGARIRVDSSHFEDAINPLISQDSTQVGFWDTNLDNVIENVTWTALPPNCTANPCSWGGTPGTTQNGGQFPSTVSYVPPYSYTVVPGADVKAHVIANSGVNRIDACLDFPGGSSSSSSSSQPAEHIFSDGFDEDFGPHAQFVENFDGATTATVLTAGYRPLSEGSATPMFHSSKPATTTIESGALAIDDSVIFSIGNSTPTIATNSGSSPSGVLDLSQQYTISFCVAAVPTPNAKKFQVYIDNNTTGSANSPHGAASRIFDIATSSLTPGQVVAITSQVGSAASFVALRVESGTKLAVDNVMIEHGASGSATCAGGGSSSSAGSSSSNSSSSTSSSSSSSSDPPGDAFDAALLPVGNVLPANMGQRTYSAPVGNLNHVAVPPPPVHINHYQNLPADPTGGALGFELETAPFLGWGSWSESGPVFVTGGSGAAPNRIYTVFTKEQLIAALNEAGNEPKIIRVVGVIDFRFTNGIYEEYTSFDDQHQGGNVVIPSNTTLVGINDANGNPARFAGTQIAIGREFSPAHAFTPGNPTPKTNYEAWVNNGQDPESYPGWTRNVIVRNLDIETPWDVNPASADSEFDGIVVSWAQQVWIDHVTIGPGQYDGTYTATRRDGALDVVRASNFVTISGSRFYTNDKTNLIGNADSGRRWSDEGRLRVTLTGNHWTYNQARMPRVRYGRVHLYNNYFQGSTASVPNQKWGNGMAIGYEGDILADSNYFHVLGLKINASNEICGKLVHHHGGGSGFRGDNLWFRSDHASALTPVLVDSHLAGCNGLPLGAWTPAYAYTAVADPTTLEASVPAAAGAGKLQ